jgi:YidC/Oxa1 family membrane protein insertase
MLEQRNLILAIALSVAIIVGFEMLTPAPPPAPEQVAQQTTGAPATGGDASSVPVVGSTAPGSVPTANNIPTPGGAPSAGAVADAVRADVIAKGPRISFDNNRIHGSISLVGGRIDDLTLTDYRETVDPTSPQIVLLSPAGTAKPYYADFGWTTGPGVKINTPTPQTLWKSNKRSLEAGSTATLSWNNGEGLTFKRMIALDEDFIFTVTDIVENQTGAPVSLYPYSLVSRTGLPQTTGFYILHEGALGVFDETLKEVDYEDMQEEQKIPVSSTGGWIGITDKYWLAALIPDQKAKINANFGHSISNGQEKFQIDYLLDVHNVAAKSSTQVVNHLFAGAKEVHVLDSYETKLNVKNFDLAVDFGWFYFLTKPFFYAIDWFYKLLGNFGLAILALTVCVRIVFYPLANKSFKAMGAMKRLQPEMTKLRERHADDKAKLNQEMMALYKKEKANPMAGCLPIALQIPVFFSLYKVLFVSIEMRHAPFYGWISDLSAADPTSLVNLFGLIPWTPPEFIPALGVWPIIMGITMFLQQKLNPQPADPMQAKIFMFLPFVFTFMLSTFPAGLVIYWSWNNTLSMAQQWIIMKRSGVKPGGKAGGKAVSK